MPPQAFRASYAQQALWLLEQLDPGEGRYQLGVDVALPRLPLTAERVAAALTVLAERHETLRTALELRDGELMQVVHPPAPVRPAFTDLSGVGTGGLAALVAADTGQPLPLEEAPLWRARTVRLGDGRWSVVIAGSHTILDATSLLNLADELREVVSAAVEGRPAALSELPIQYADYAQWQRGEVEAGRLEPQLAFWRARLAGLPDHHRLPTDRPRPAVLSSAGGVVEARVDDATAARIRALARERGTTLFTVSLGALGALVGRLSGETDVVIGTPVTARDLPELTPLVGLLVNTLVLRLDLAGDPSFGELVGRARLAVLEALEHQDVPFDLLVSELAPRRDRGWNPLYQVGLNLLPARGFGALGTAPRAGFGYTSGDDAPRGAVARFDLHLDVFELTDGLVGALEYARDLFDDATARRLVGQWALLLAAGAAEPDRRLSRLPLVAPAERAALLAASRPRSPEPPAIPPVASVLDALAARPNAVAVRIAAAPPSGASPVPGTAPVTGAEPVSGLEPVSDAEVVSGAEPVTGAELAARAAAVALAVTGHGAGPERVVAVLLPGGTIEWVAAVLGVLAAGAVLLPIDPAVPVPRRAYLLADARPLAVVASGLPARLPPGLPVVDLAAPGSSTPRAAGPDSAVPRDPVPAAAVPGAVVPDVAAGDGVGRESVHIGPTGAGAVLAYPPGGGLPRGVLTDTAALSARVAQLIGLLDAVPGRSWALPADTGPDLLVPLLAALASGGTVHFGPPTADHTTADHTTADHAAVDHVLTARPAAGGWPAGLSVRTGGTSVGVVGWPETGPVLVVDDDGARPLGHTGAALLDRDGEPVPDGAAGALHLTGPVLARGYLRRPEPTAGTLRPDPAAPAARLFRTGLTARRGPDGTLTRDD